MQPPRDAIDAVTHADPYPFYARWVAERPLHRDEALGLWVASGADAVRAAMTSPHLRVRPPAEPVPAAIAGGALGALFGRWVRMTDGPRQQALKACVVQTLDALGAERIDAAARVQAQALLRESAALPAPARMAALASRLPARTTAALLGVPAPWLAETEQQLAALVRAVAPGASAEDVQRGHEAAGALLERGRAVLEQPEAFPGALLPLLWERAREAGVDDVDAVLANGIAFGFQSHDATAGLIGNTLLALARRPELQGDTRSRPAALAAIVREVSRHDAPVQNTRRFAAQDCTLAGHVVRAGEAVLVVLAAANRDPAANPQPERFDPHRAEPRCFTFGLGPHACPGERLAVGIAAAAVEGLLAAGLDLAPLAGPARYRPLPNARIPLLDPRAASA